MTDDEQDMPDMSDEKTARRMATAYRYLARGLNASSDPGLRAHIEQKMHEQVEREVAQLRHAIETGADHTAHAVYARVVEAVLPLYDTRELVLEVMPEDEEGPGPHNLYSLTLTNGFETFYRASDAPGARADVFFTLEDIVKAFPGLEWRPL